MIDRREVEEYLGLDYFCVEGRGTGGILKTRVDDFRVKNRPALPPWTPKVGLQLSE